MEGKGREAKQSIPERTDETPDLTDKRDEDTDAGRLFGMAVYSIGDQDRRYDLVSNTGDRDPDHGSDIPMQLHGILRLHEENHHAHNRQHEPGVAQPKPILGLRPHATHLLRLAIHPVVAQAAAQLLADDGAEDDAEELVA